MKVTVSIVPAKGAAPAAQLAHKELVHWLSAACPKARFGRASTPDHADFVLGTFDDLAAIIGRAFRNDRWIDEVLVRTVDGRLILAGSNPRSVLFAVYTYLDRLGFAWIVPGPDGEIVPRLKNIARGCYDVHHRASLMYRGFALAGAFDAEMGERFVEWMARNRFNHLFLEGDSRRSSYQQALGRKVSLAEARRFNARLIRATKQRGMIFEKMGHGWTAQALGLPPNRRQRKGLQLSDEQRAMAAKLGGVGGVRTIPPGNTQLCLSNPKSHRRMTELVCQYAESHPQLDVLAVWMADGFNNWCECPKCQKVHPSDLWVRLINRISREVHKARPELRIEVLSYSVLMEPPPNERIDTSRGNVILMYAPFLRCYLHRLDDPRCVSDSPLRTFPPANRLHHSMNAEYFGFFNGWLKHFKGTNYIFDYYCWLPIKRDFFEGDVPETICRDMKSYPSHGIMGCVDCSRAQSFWPTPLARALQARASWDASVDYRVQRRRLLGLAFGEHAKLVDRYLALAYECLLPSRHGREEERGFSPAKVRRFKRSLPAVRRALDKAVAASRGAEKKFLRRVAVHAEFTLLHLDCLLAESAGRYDKAAGLARRMHALARRNARGLAGAADGPEFAWLERDTLKRLAAKKDGTYKRID